MIFDGSFDSRRPPTTHDNILPQSKDCPRFWNFSKEIFNQFDSKGYPYQKKIRNNVFKQIFWGFFIFEFDCVFHVLVVIFSKLFKIWLHTKESQLILHIFIRWIFKFFKYLKSKILISRMVIKLTKLLFKKFYCLYFSNTNLV